MTEEKKILYTVDIEGNEELLQELARLRKETADLKNENRDYNRALKSGEKVSKENARNFERNTIQVKQNNASIRNLTKELQGANQQKENARKRLTDMRRALQEMALAGDTSSEAYRELRNEASELQDAIDRVNQEVKVFADDAMVINTVVDATRGLTAGFQGVMGVQALLGFESEKFRETMQRLVAVQQVSNALQTVSNLLQKESRLVILGKVAATKIATAAQWAWNAAMTANPIGAIIVAIAALSAGVVALVRNFDNVTAAIGRAANWLVFWRDLGSAVDDVNESVEGVIANTERMQTRVDNLRRQTDRTTQMLEHQINLMRIMGVDEIAIQEERVRVQELRLEGLKEERDELNENILTLRRLGRVQAEIADGEGDFTSEEIKEANEFLENYEENLSNLEQQLRDVNSEIDNTLRSLAEQGMTHAVMLDETRKSAIESGEELAAEQEKNTIKLRIVQEELLDDKLKLLEIEKQETINASREARDEIISNLEEQRERMLDGMTPDEYIDDIRKSYAEEFAFYQEEREKGLISEERYFEKIKTLREHRLKDEEAFQKEIERIDNSLEFLTSRNESELLIIEEFEQKRLDLIEEYNNREQELRNQFLEDVRRDWGDFHGERLEVIDEHYKNELITTEEYNKLLAEINKEEDNRRLEVEKLFQETRANVIDSGYIRERQLLRQKYNDQLITSEEYYVKLNELEEEYQGEKKFEEIREWYNREKETLKEHLNDKLITNKEYEMLLQELERNRRMREQEIELEQFEEERTRYMEHLQSIRDLEEGEFNQRREMYQQWLRDNVISQEEYNNAIKRLDEDLLDFRRENATAQAQAMVASYRTMTQGLSQLMANQEEESAFFKAMAIADATIALMLGLAQTWKAGFPQAIPMAIGYVAQTAGLVSQITSTKQPTAPKLAKGGMIGGKPHSQGGTIFKGSDGSIFEAERDEYLAIINKRDADRAQMFDQINQEHGKPFGYTKYNDGGIFHTTIRQFDSGGKYEPRHDFERIDMNDVIREAVNEIGQIPVVVAERDISTTQDRVRQVEVKGDM